MIREAFDDCYIPEPNSGCWLWLFGLKAGYGQVCLPVHNEVGAHIFSYERVNGPVKSGECVLHRCDVRSCVNPDHLFVGTKKDNAIDMARKGRQRMQKLSLSDVAAIKDDARSQHEIARAYGVNQSQISRIKSQKRWAHCA
jgi:HNH endonuclease